MGQYRALLTDREREILRGDAEVSNNYHNQIRHRVREKIAEFEGDVAILSTHEPDLAAELYDVLVTSFEREELAPISD